MRVVRHALHAGSATSAVAALVLGTLQALLAPPPLPALVLSPTRAAWSLPLLLGVAALAAEAARAALGQQEARFVGRDYRHPDK